MYELLFKILDSRFYTLEGAETLLVFLPVEITKNLDIKLFCFPGEDKLFKYVYAARNSDLVTKY